MPTFCLIVLFTHFCCYLAKDNFRSYLQEIKNALWQIVKLILELFNINFCTNRLQVKGISLPCGVKCSFSLLWTQSAHLLHIQRLVQTTRFYLDVFGVGLSSLVHSQLTDLRIAPHSAVQSNIKLAVDSQKNPSKENIGFYLKPDIFAFGLIVSNTNRPSHSPETHGKLYYLPLH